MELVSASKMRRAQESALSSRQYTKRARQILTRLRELTDVSKHPLFITRPVKTRLLIVMTSDRGLAGSYNSNVLKTFTRELQSDRDNGIHTKVLLIGKQAAKFAARIKDIDIVGAYNHLPEKPSVTELLPIIETAKKLFTPALPLTSDDFIDDDMASSATLTSPEVDKVDVIFTDFRSSISQEVTVSGFLPAAFSNVAINEDLENAMFEPSPQVVLNTIVDRLVEVQLWQSYLESQASEHSSRMMAMKTASDNASELIDDLTLSANTARQAAITQELAEITGGAEAMK
jgi:F-type H+-transporting ATPase subunit gamma